jgi:hypothetical protein
VACSALAALSLAGRTRGTGFIARFLIAWPASTQRTRAYRSTPASTPAVNRFTGRITALLDMPLPTDALGGLTPVTLDLSPSARGAWIRAHDDIESGLGIGGDYPSLRAGHRTVRGHLRLRRRPSLDHLGHEGGTAGGRHQHADVYVRRRPEQGRLSPAIASNPTDVHGIPAASEHQLLFESNSQLRTTCLQIPY